jgi:glycosyltransferase involved in cell wall biosynthesis
MNYVFLTTEFPPFHGGGISTYCKHTAELFNQNGSHVTVIVSDHSAKDELIIENINGIKIIRFHPGKKKYYNILGYAAALSLEFAEILEAEIEASGTPDYIEIQDYKGIGYYTLQHKLIKEDCQYKKVPIVVTVHSPSYLILEYDQYPTYQLPEYWIGEMEKFCITAADIIFFPSQFAYNKIYPTLNRESSENVHVVNHPFNLETAVLNNESPLHNRETNDIVFFGKLTYMKGPLHLLTFFSHLWDDGFNYTLHLVGDDHFYTARQTSMKEFLIKKFKRHYENGKFVLEGKLTPENVKTRLQNARIVIIPSLFETFSYACAEAMAYSKTLIVSDSGAQKELVEKYKSGFVFEQGNFESFKKCLFTALALSKNEENILSERNHQFLTRHLNPTKIYAEKIKKLNSFNNPGSTTYPFIRHIEIKTPRVDKPFEKDLLTIIVPFYNVGKYLKETIENIYATDYPLKEIIVINDGSDDPESIAILYQLKEKYQFKLVNQFNKGLPEARNTGATHASGEFLAYLDADDMVDKSYYTKAITVLKKFKNVSFVGCWTKYFDGYEGIWPTFNPEPPYILLHNTLNTSALVFKRNDFLTAGMNDPKFMYTLEDQDAIVNMISNGFRGIALPEVLFFYRIHPTSMSKQFNKANLLHGYNLLSKKYKHLYEQYAVDIYNFLNSNGPSYLYDNPTWEPHTDVRKLWDKISILEKEKEDLLNDSSQNHSNTLSQDNGQFASHEIPLSHDKELTYKEKFEITRIWYHKEYEVLPLWYKRLGHIIKVIKGKKNVRSLFESKEANK